MATHAVLHFLRRLRPSHHGPAAADAELVARFVASGNEAAFAALVQRHGPMVWRVCVRVLGNAASAEDAFQAAFFVLARRAGTLARPERLANWLYGVAYRTAARVRANATRRQTPLIDEPASKASPVHEAIHRECLRRLDDELSRLPDRYRLPLVLHYLEGRTQEEVARLLGCPRATVATRLTRGCRRLRTRLESSGVALGSGGLTAALAEETSAALPPALLEATVRAAPLFAAGGSALAPSAAAVFAEGVLHTMFVLKVKVAVACVLLIGTVVAGAGAIAQQGLTPGAVAQAQSAAPQPAPAEDRDETVQKELEKLQGTWVLTAVEHDGGKGAPQDVTSDARLEWTIRGNQFTFGQVGPRFKRFNGFLRIDPRKQPKTMDASFTAAFKPGETGYQIYQLDGATLKVCGTNREWQDDRPENRPREFRTRPGSKVNVTYWKKTSAPADAQGGKPAGDNRQPEQLRAPDGLPRATVDKLLKELPPDDRLSRLRREQYAAAREELDGTWQWWLSGRGGGVADGTVALDGVLVACRRVLQAELDLSAKPEIHAAALEGHVRRLKEVEAVSTAKYKAGMVNSVSLTHVRFERIRAEIWREQFKSGGKLPADAPALSR